MSTKFLDCWYDLEDKINVHAREVPYYVLFNENADICDEPFTPF